MSAFAIVLLSQTMFGGAQKRFFNLHRHFRSIYGEKAWFIVSPAMKAEIEKTYGHEYCQGVHAIGEAHKSNSLSATQAVVKKPKSGLINSLKSSIAFDIYFYFKSRKRTKKQFELIDEFAKEKGINSFLAVYSGVLPLYFYFDRNNRKQRIVFSNMDSWFSHFEENKFKRFFRQYTLFHRAHEQSDHVDVLSPFILNGLKFKKYLPAKQSYSITACSFIDYSSCENGEKASLDYIFSSRLEEDKNPMNFLEAAMKLGPKYPATNFHILGKGRLSDSIILKLKSYPLNNIKYHGFVSNPCSFFAETSVFVSLQTDNNYPSQSVLEAMACGNAIIASDVGDTRLFVNENNGWLIKNTTEDLIFALENCVNNRQEVSSRGAFAADYVRDNFTVEKAAAYYHSLLYPDNDGK